MDFRTMPPKDEEIPFIVKVFFIPVTKYFIQLMVKHQHMHKIYCKCIKNPKADEAAVRMPSYRLCMEEECNDEKSCQEESGEYPFCTVDISHASDQRRSCKSLERRTGNEKIVCPNRDQFLYLKQYIGLCLDSEDKYRTHGLCRAINHTDNITWQVGFAFQVTLFPKLAETIKKLGFVRRKSDSCSKDVGAEVNLGTEKVRVLQTYQLAQTLTSLTVSNLSACNEARPMRAIFCLDRKCKAKSDLDGSCESGWEISLDRFKHFRHQIIITDEHRPNVSAAWITQQMKLFFEILPVDRTFLRFFVIPNRILMLPKNESGNFTCLYPGGQENSSGPSCQIPSEGIFWQTCFPKFQRFKIADPWPKPPNATSPNPLDPSSEEALKWWVYLLIAVGILLVTVAIVVIIVVRIRRNRYKKPTKQMAIFHHVADIAEPPTPLLGKGPVFQQTKPRRSEMSESSSSTKGTQEEEEEEESLVEPPPQGTTEVVKDEKELDQTATNEKTKTTPKKPPSLWHLDKTPSLREVELKKTSSSAYHPKARSRSVAQQPTRATEKTKTSKTPHGVILPLSVDTKFPSRHQ